MQKKKAIFTRYIDKHTGKCFRNLKDAELGGDQVHQRARQGHVGRHGRRQFIRKLTKKTEN